MNEPAPAHDDARASEESVEGEVSLDQMSEAGTTAVPDDESAEANAAATDLPTESEVSLDDVGEVEPPAARADEAVGTLMDEPTATIDELATEAVGDQEPEGDETPTVDEVSDLLEEEEPDAEQIESVTDQLEAEAETAAEAALEDEPEAAVVDEVDEAINETPSEAAVEGEAPTAEEEMPTIEETPAVEEETPAAETVSSTVDVEPELAAAVEEALEGAEEEELPPWVPGEWFVVHTYAGYENKVKADLETRVASMNMEEKIYEVVIPMEKVMEIKGGKKVEVERKVFPGYLLVRMDLDDDSWYVVRNTPGVTGFVGSGTRPIPLSEREVDRILQRKGEAEKPKPKLEWTANDPVRVTTGPFANFQGVISDVDDERQKVKVLVNIFGRETPVELSYDQIAKV